MAYLLLGTTANPPGNTQSTLSHKVTQETFPVSSHLHIAVFHLHIPSGVALPRYPVPMTWGVNKVFLLGTVGTEPKIEYTARGLVVARLWLVTRERVPGPRWQQRELPE